MPKPIIALMYDFDRTLAIDDMQNFTLIPKLGYTPKEFWERTEDFCKKYDMDKILGYLYMILEVAKEKNIPITKEFMAECGKSIKFFDGVTTWFNRINKYAEEKGMIVEHYLITSGNSEIVKGSSIYKEFKKVFGCKYLFDNDGKGEAYWPRTIVNYTLKTQYIFRISKGVTEDNDDKEINEKTINRRISYQNMIYMGDGLTDVPCMILVKQQGGASIAVYAKNQPEKVYHLLEDGRVDYLCKADYSANSELEKVVKLLIDGMSIRESLKAKKQKAEKII